MWLIRVSLYSAVLIKLLAIFKSLCLGNIQEGFKLVDILPMHCYWEDANGIISHDGSKGMTIC